MAQNLKRMISMINKGKDLDVWLPQYTGALGQVYCENAIVHFLMNYYVMFEQTAEHQMDQTEKTAVDAINRAVEILSYEREEQEIREAVEALSQIRTSVMNRMDVLTAYADRLQIYEYLLNRMEYSYQENVCVPDESVFTQKLLQFIFSSKENVVVNETIQEVVGQLPVRMARSRFFEILKNSIALYKDSDKESLKSFQYMLETSAGIYEPAGQSEYFTELGAEIDAFRTVDYETLSEEEFHNMQETLADLTGRLLLATDRFMILQEVINPLLAYAEALPYAKENEVMEKAREITTAILDLFGQKDAAQIPDEIDAKLMELEGIQEELNEKQQLLEAVLDQILLSNKDQAQQLGLLEALLVYQKISKLLSTSIFIDTEGTEDSLPVEKNDIEKAQEELIEKMAVLFKERPIRYLRAVIANTLPNVPVFFQNSDEVKQYIEEALAQCHDPSEKKVSMELLEQLMEAE
ncbi:MAG: hypothetical protein PUB10_03900 [Clostridiales bacterium]|nr:hypothetical protein [Clostridiales bacterium]